MVRPLRNSVSPAPAEPEAASGAADPKLPRYRSPYSRFVWLMKYALPVIAGVVMLLVVVWPELKQQPERFPISLADIKVETAGGQRVMNARFTGVDNTNRPFSVTADAVIQDVDGATGVALRQPKADVTLASNSWVAIAAPKGTFWRKREVLDLFGGVDLFHDDGYEFQTAEARIDFRNGAASGDRPVRGQGPFGTIAAEGFSVLDNGDRILFKGKSRLMLFPSAPRPGAGK